MLMRIHWKLCSGSCLIDLTCSIVGLRPLRNLYIFCSKPILCFHLKNPRSNNLKILWHFKLPLESVDPFYCWCWIVPIIRFLLCSPYKYIVNLTSMENEFLQYVDHETREAELFCHCWGLQRSFDDLQRAFWNSWHSEFD